MQSIITEEYPNPIVAVYQDGFVLNEAVRNDISLYDPKRNTMYDIVNKLPEKEHGKMIRFSIFANGWIQIDWRKVPLNAKPIRVKHMQIEHNTATGNTGEQKCVKIDFGFEYVDKKTGRNVQELREIT